MVSCKYHISLELKANMQKLYLQISYQLGTSHSLKKELNIARAYFPDGKIEVPSATKFVAIVAVDLRLQ